MPDIMACCITLPGGRARVWAAGAFLFLLALEHFRALLRPESLAWVRGLSSLFGAGTVVMVFSLGRRLGGMFAGCAAALVMASSPR